MEGLAVTVRLIDSTYLYRDMAAGAIAKSAVEHKTCSNNHVLRPVRAAKLQTTDIFLKRFCKVFARTAAGMGTGDYPDGSESIEELRALRSSKMAIKQSRTVKESPC
jgi:hypothetical protein